MAAAAESPELRVTWVDARLLRAGAHAFLDGCPCELSRVHAFRTGKHGHACIRATGVGVLTKEEHTVTFHPSQPVAAPVVGVSHAQLVGLSVDGVAKVKMADGTLRSDLQLADKTALLQDRMRALIDSEGYVAVRITSVCMCKAIVAC